MKKSIKVLLIVISLIIIYCVIKNINKLNNVISEKNLQVDNEEQQEINEVKHEIGINAPNELYEIQIEYDGKKILNIKPEIQFKIAFAGIKKQELPKIDEIDTIFEKEYPQENGIWIEENSKEIFLRILKEETNNKYQIDQNGYLKIQEENKYNDEDMLLKNMITGNRKYIVTISGIYYEADRVTGEILDNFFEDIDPYQTSKTVEWRDNVIIYLSTNKEKLLTNKEILQELTIYGKQIT